MTRKIMEKINKKIDKLTNDLREMNDFVRKFQDPSEVILFWDIENARIPVNKSGYELVSIIESYIESIYPDKKIVIKC